MHYAMMKIKLAIFDIALFRFNSILSSHSPVSFRTVEFRAENDNEEKEAEMSFEENKNSWRLHKKCAEHKRKRCVYLYTFREREIRSENKLIQTKALNL